MTFDTSLQKILQVKITLFKSSRNILLAALACIFVSGLLLRFIFPAPPKHLRISSGPQGSFFSEIAYKYRDEFAKEGVTLEIVHTSGAFENLEYVKKGNSDIALTHGGITIPENAPGLVSLGSISYEPIWLFRRRGTTPVNDVRQIKGMRVNIGAVNSGLDVIALKLLNISGLDHNNTKLFHLSPNESIEELLSGRIDFGFFKDPPEDLKIHALFKSNEILEVDLKDSEAFRRNLRFLHVTHIAPSSIDMAHQQPPSDFHTVSVTNTVVVQNSLNKSIQYLLLSVMAKVHQHPTLISHENEFPSDKDIDLPLSQEAEFFYKKGMPFLTQYLPFELASITERLFKALIPVLLLIFPFMNLIPNYIEWKTKRKFSKLYKLLVEIEMDIYGKDKFYSTEYLENRLSELRVKLDQEKIPQAFLSEIYVLREHIEFARTQLSQYTGSKNI